MKRAVIGLRGATTVDVDAPEEIFRATRELMTEIMEKNDLKAADIVSVVFSCTPDLRSAYPAAEVRRMGIDVPLFCVQEMDVVGSLPKTIRVLLHVERGAVWQSGEEAAGLPSGKPRHVYLRKAATLRPDLADQ